MPETLIIVVLDESESMIPKKSNVIEGFNSFISRQKKVEEDQARLYLVKFNDVVTVVHKAVDLNSVLLLTDQSYTPSGGNALYDAIARSVSLTGDHKEERVVCVIMTDGEENSSGEASKEEVKSLITTKRGTSRWTFLYIGNKPDQWAKDFGLDPDQVMPVCEDVRQSFDRINQAVAQGREFGHQTAFSFKPDNTGDVN